MHQQPAQAAAQAEAIRMIIWDLDETFWRGTLSEQGIAWSPENAEIVRALSKRGIINSICSKNDRNAVELVLAEHQLDEHFVFSSINWESKGPRLAALVQAVQLRPQSILFIDDNPMNRAEAQSYVPGMHVADETIIPYLLDNPRLRGEPDPQEKRLAQYRLLEHRQSMQSLANTDTTSFLRESAITVEINHDLIPHLDRVVELINRTNQLNFTKRRLHADPELAREQMRVQLSRFGVQAGIIHVRDRFGDHGYCGVYVLVHNAATAPTLLHFAFSCRILGMGIETWLYNWLQRPELVVAGSVVTDVINDRRAIDWITAKLPGLGEVPALEDRPLAYVLARGGCEMRALTHYFAMVTKRVVEEFTYVRNGQTPLISSSMIAAQSLNGTPPSLIRDAAKLGFLPEDFSPLILHPPAQAPALWLLSFGLESVAPLLRHKETGYLLPLWVQYGLNGPVTSALTADPLELGFDPDLQAHLRTHFEMAGPLTQPQFADALRKILTMAPQGVRVFILLSNERKITADGTSRVVPVRRNELARDIATEFPHTETIAPGDFITDSELAAQDNPQHYDRVVYFRIFQHVMLRLLGEERENSRS